MSDSLGRLVRVPQTRFRPCQSARSGWEGDGSRRLLTSDHSTPPNSIFGQPTTVAEVATTAVELFRASLEYVDLFTHLIMCTKPANAPAAAELLGKVSDTGYRPPKPHATEAGEGLRVWRSCKNAVNHSGNGSASGASVCRSAFTGGRAGSRLSDTPPR